ncbi:interleukin-2 receptor subunit beta-like [Scleropages formosus]|nr:interleukin-2 receptor subunit beta-like [Scleropages formosus]XP_018601584.1 interleukin-2 receptor subunit beta-like [Scleropages formosus]
MGTVCLLPLLLFLGCFPWCIQGVQSLECLNDFFENINCTWNSTGVDPERPCILKGELFDSEIECALVPLEVDKQKWRGCNLYFPGAEFGHFTSVILRVMCGNSTSPVASIMNYETQEYTKLHPPGLPKIVNSTITWSPGEPMSPYLSYYSFQLQYKRSDQKWEEVSLTDLKNRQAFLQLLEENFEKEVVYQARVRIKMDDVPNAHWSDWSPIASWRSTIGRSPPAEDGKTVQHLMLLIAIPAVLVCLFMVFIFRANGSNWMKPVPDPSKFFEVLNSVHNGNFQKWLQPIFAAESFVAPQPPEDISPVEVSNANENDMLFRKELRSLSEHCDNSAQSSSFSNMGYFCSRHPSSYEIETCTVYFSYQPVGGSTDGDAGVERKVDSGPLQMCSSYKPLDQLGQPRHLHSHSELSNEDQQREDKEKSVAPCKLSDTLPFLLPCGPLPHTLPGFPQFPSPFVGLHLATALGRNASPLEGSLFKSSSLSIEPSGEGYMPVKNTNNSC